MRFFLQVLSSSEVEHHHWLSVLPPSSSSSVLPPSSSLVFQQSSPLKSSNQVLNLFIRLYGSYIDYNLRQLFHTPCKRKCLHTSLINFTQARGHNTKLPFACCIVNISASSFGTGSGSPSYGRRAVLILTDI